MDEDRRTVLHGINGWWKFRIVKFRTWDYHRIYFMSTQVSQCIYFRSVVFNQSNTPHEYRSTWVLFDWYHGKTLIIFVYFQALVITLNLGSKSALVSGRCYVLVCNLRKLSSTGSNSPYFENRKLVRVCTSNIKNRRLVCGWKPDIVSRML